MNERTRDEKKYYVYEWYVVPSGEVFYVGKGTGRRYKTRKRENEFFMKFMKTHECSSRIVRDNLTEQEALDYEKELIAHYRSVPNNRLTNVQDGGENPPTHYGDASASKRPEVREKIRNSNKKRFIDNPLLKQEVSARMKRFCGSEEGKKILSNRSKLVMQNDSTRKKLSESVKEHYTDAERKKVSERMKKLYSTSEMRASVTGKNNGASRTVSQYTVDGAFIASFQTLKEAEEATGISHKNISKSVRGHNKTAGGYVWKFADTKAINYRKRVYKERPVRKNKRPILQYAKDGSFICEYDSIADATAINGFKDHSNISICLSGRTKTAYGYIWKYKDTHDDTVPSLFAEEGVTTN